MGSVGVDLNLTAPPPLWASGSGAPPGPPRPQWRPSAREFGLFVKAVAKRYSGAYKPPGSSAALPRVSFWSIWNEPNYGPQLAPQAINRSTVEVSPALYRQLADAGWTALHETGHGGGFVFDGRSLPNPGREERFKALTGRDAPVIEYLSQQESVHQFLAGVMSLVDSSVSAYQRRGFKNLMVSFGCTGGQHRSVYLAEQLAKHLRAASGVEVVVRHVQLEKLGLEMPALEMPGQ